VPEVTGLRPSWIQIQFPVVTPYSSPLTRQNLMTRPRPFFGPWLTL
jgi:hypothetical protein